MEKTVQTKTNQIRVGIQLQYSYNTVVLGKTGYTGQVLAYAG